jgi:hypothetical protein
LAVEAKHDRLLIQRGKAEVEVFAGEIRHVVNTLAEAAVRLVDQGYSGGIAFACTRDGALECWTTRVRRPRVC